MERLIYQTSHTFTTPEERETYIQQLHAKYDFFTSSDIHEDGLPLYKVIFYNRWDKGRKAYEA